jgi:hypothetical protein
MNTISGRCAISSFRTQSSFSKKVGAFMNLTFIGQAITLKGDLASDHGRFQVGSPAQAI